MYQRTLSYIGQIEKLLQTESLWSTTATCFEEVLNRDLKLEIKDIPQGKVDIITMLCLVNTLDYRLEGAASQTVLEIGCNLETFSWWG